MLEASAKTYAAYYVPKVRFKAHFKGYNAFILPHCIWSPLTQAGNLGSEKS